MIKNRYIFLVVALIVLASLAYIEGRGRGSSSRPPDLIPAPATTTAATSTVAGTMLPKNFGTLRGTLTIGPNCPVERAGVPCNPTPEAYASRKVSVYTYNRSKLVTTLTPDAQGKFTASLPAAMYVIDVAHSAIGGVRGAPANIQISAGRTSAIAIDIDTGIR